MFMDSNTNNILYIFKYNAINEFNEEVNDYFLAYSLDDCRIFLDLLGYRSINVSPLKVGEEKPDISKKLDLENISVELADLSNSLKNDTDLFRSVLDFVKKVNGVNKSIYLRVAYFIYKGDSLSVSMKKLGDVIPTDIIEQIELGELSNDIPKQLAVLIRKYATMTKKKKGLFGLFSKKAKDEFEVVNNNLEDIKNNNSGNYGRDLYPFKYIVQDEVGKKVTGYFNAESIDDCRHFLENQGYRVVKLEPKKNYDIEIVLSNKVKPSQLAFDLTQLSTYIKAGIPLVDGVAILAKQANSVAARNAYQRLVYDLLKGDDLSVAMSHQGMVFPKLLVNMVKSAEMTGDLPTILDDMAEYYEEMEQTKKTMKSALTYPLFVLALAIGVLAFMMLVLVPQFVVLYQTNGAQLPDITLAIIGISNFIVNNYLYILLVLLILISAFIVCYKNMPQFKKTVQMILMKLPGIGKIIIYNEIYNFTKTFASLLNHGVFITDSMEILSNITNNEIYKGIISKTLSNLAKGEKISESFKGEWAFPVVAYHMLVTGENTGQLGLMMEKVSDHYKQLHKSLVNQLKSLLEPIMILIVAVIVGIILLAIVTPMFDIYSQIR